jgi:phage repressor protein C with HTH and peptisase S24 domain
MPDNLFIEKGERLKEIRNFLGYGGRKLSEFAGELDYYQSNLSKIENGERDIPTSLLEKLSKRYNISSDWLLYGVGSQTLSSNETTALKATFDKPNVSFYDINALAGLSSGVDQFEHIAEKWYIPTLIGDHVAVNVSGNSMESTIFEGDKVIAKKVTSPSEMRHGEIYIFIYDGAPLIKRLHLDKGSVTLLSDNPFYDNIVADRDRISSVFRVVMHVRILCK